MLAISCEHFNSAKDFKWDVIQMLFKKANAINNNAVHAQHKQEKGTSEAWRAGAGAKTSLLQKTLLRRRASKVVEQRDREYLTVDKAILEQTPYVATRRVGSKLGSPIEELPPCDKANLFEILAVLDLRGRSLSRNDNPDALAKFGPLPIYGQTEKRERWS